MKMILFRPSFVTAGTMLQATALLCIFSSITSVSAVPQFGRPQVHVLDGESVSSSVDPTGAVNDTSTPSIASAQSSGAIHGLGGGIHTQTALVLSAAASVVLLAF